MNDVSRRWWNIRHEPTDVVTCCIQHSRVSELRNSGERTIAQWHSTGHLLTELRKRSEMDAAFEEKLDIIERSPATGKFVAEIINLSMDDFFYEKWQRNGTKRFNQT